jgi:hypothetical protein
MKTKKGAVSERSEKKIGMRGTNGSTAELRDRCSTARFSYRCRSQAKSQRRGKSLKRARSESTISL